MNSLHFQIIDKKTPKRTASQEIEQIPVYISGDVYQTVSDKEDRVLIYAIPKFTIPEAKLLTIELQEKNGGRHLKLVLKNKHIMKAKKI